MNIKNRVAAFSISMVMSYAISADQTPGESQRTGELSKNEVRAIIDPDTGELLQPSAEEPKIPVDSVPLPPSNIESGELPKQIMMPDGSVAVVLGSRFNSNTYAKVGCDGRLRVSHQPVKHGSREECGEKK